MFYFFIFQKEKIREKFVSVLEEEFKGKGLSFSIGEWATASVFNPLKLRLLEDVFSERNII